MNTTAARGQSAIPLWWIIAIWTGFAVIDASQTVFGMHAEGMHHEWGKLFALHFLSWLPWPVATAIIMAHARPHALNYSSIQDWAVHAAGIVLLFLISSAWSALLDALLDPWLASPPRPSFIHLLEKYFYSWILPTLILYAFILAVSVALRSRETMARQKIETARLNEQLATAHLSALRQQIEPHFLFNTLNAIVGLMRDQRIDSAISAVVGLSEFLRGTLKDSHRQFVTLREELDMLHRYAEIQKTRFGDRLSIEVEVPGQLLSTQVPTPVLQPLVENAIKHGIEKRAHGGQVRIHAERSNQNLVLRVYNDGPPLANSSEPTQSGIGIKNLRTRLQILFGERFELNLRNRGAGVEVMVKWPIEREAT